MTAEYTDILCGVQDGVARITLNRPPLNILDIGMMGEINRALEGSGASGEAGVLVIDHRGKAFSAGVDIKDHTPDKVEEMIEAFHRMFRLLSSLSLPTLALVDGAALGGGCELATFCDMVLASDRSKFGQPEIKVGVFPPVAAVTLPRLIGRNRTLELLLTGEVIDASEAERIGLVNRVFASDVFREEAEAFAGKLAALSAPVLRLTKRAVDETLDTGFEDGISRAEKIYLEEAMRLEDAREGLNAFLEKRPPVWKNE